MVTGEDPQRRWSLGDYQAYLEARAGPGAYESRVLPGVRAAVRGLFAALRAPPCALAPAGAEGGRRVRRFGLDLLVDEGLAVWLIEANILKDGFALGYAPKGPAGDAKRVLVRQLVADEEGLRVAVRAGSPEEAPAAFERLL